MKHVVIVGAGLFGSIAAALAHRSGFRVTVIDRGDKLAGSGPAACLMKPGWLSGIANKDVEAGLSLLGALYELKTIPFRVNGVALTGVYWVDPKTILLGNHLKENITHVKGNVWSVRDDHVVVDGERIECDAALIAAGVWTGELAATPPIKRLAGAAFNFDAPCPEPFIKVWAPYKQLVGFEREAGKTWVGDGSAILEKNFTRDRFWQSANRCEGVIGRRSVTFQEGLRPYVEGHKAGYFERRSDRVWISTGGAKNGTIIAAIQAQRFVDDITHFL